MLSKTKFLLELIFETKKISYFWLGLPSFVLDILSKFQSKLSSDSIEKHSNPLKMHILCLKTGENFSGLHRQPKSLSVTDDDADIEIKRMLLVAFIFIRDFERLYSEIYFFISLFHKIWFNKCTSIQYY